MWSRRADFDLFSTAPETRNPPAKCAEGIAHCRFRDYRARITLGASFNYLTIYFALASAHLINRDRPKLMSSARRRRREGERKENERRDEKCARTNRNGADAAVLSSCSARNALARRTWRISFASRYNGRHVRSPGRLMAVERLYYLVQAFGLPVNDVRVCLINI